MLRAWASRLLQVGGVWAQEQPDELHVTREQVIFCMGDQV